MRICSIFNDCVTTSEDLSDSGSRDERPNGSAKISLKSSSKL